MLGQLIGGDHDRWPKPLPSEFVELWNSTRHECTQPHRFPWLIPIKGSYHLYTDASSLLVGGIIRMVVDGHESGDLEDFCQLSSEYHINVLELDGVIYGLQRLEQYASPGAVVVVLSDSKSCVAWVNCAITDGIIRTKSLHKSLIKTRVKILKEMINANRWDFSVSWIQGAHNPADALTRVPKPMLEYWRSLKKLGDYDDEEEETLLMGAITTEDARWDKLIRSYHEDHLHPGKTAMLTGLRPRQIPEITERVKRILGACTLCQLKRPPVPYVNLKTDHPQPSQAWEWSQMDTLSISHDPPLKAIIIIDEFSRWIEMLLITGAPSATAVIQLLSQWVSRHQPPAGWHLRADRGSEFRNTEVGKWVKSHGGTLHLSTTRRPTACGMVERVNRTLLTMMRIAKYTSPKDHPATWARRAIEEYWNRPHTALQGHTPNQMLRINGMYVPGPEYVEELDSSDDESDYAEIEVTPGTIEERNPQTPTGEIETEQPDSWHTPASLNPDIAPLSPRFHVGDQVIAHIPRQEKLDFSWTPAEVTRVHQNNAVTVAPTGHRETVLNQQWVRPLQTDMENIARSEASVARATGEDAVTRATEEEMGKPPVRRSARTRKPNMRYQQ